MGEVVHSKLGASGAERWMNCPGSVALLSELKIVESDDPLYRREGTAMHEAAQDVLTDRVEEWDLVGREYEGVTIDAAMAQAISVYVLHARRIAVVSDRHFVEYKISSPVHPDFFGTADFAAVSPLMIDVMDLKGGEGIVVEPEENPQIMYYAFGVVDGLERQEGMVFSDDLPVRLTICQPRAFHADGPIREWMTTVGAIKEWVHDTLVPAMARTEYDDMLDAGPWCRFCPAKLVCPLLTSLFGAAAKANPKHLVDTSDQAIGRSYQHIAAVKHYLKAIEETALARLNLGREIPGTKLVHKKSNRVWNDGAADLAKKRFGDTAVTPPEVLSPAALEKLSPEAREFVKEFAHHPISGLTVALASDSRQAVKVTTAVQAFSGYGESDV